MFMSGESPFAASNAATITPNSIVNTSSIAAHIGFADAAESTANKHSVDGLTKRPAVKGVAVGAHANACCAKAGRHPNVGSLPRRRQVGKSGLPVDDLGKTRCCGPIRSRCISFEASHSTTQHRRCRWWSGRLSKPLSQQLQERPACRSAICTLALQDGSRTRWQRGIERHGM